MSANTTSLKSRRAAPAPAAPLPAPLVWTFDGHFAQCLADVEDTLRRAIVMVGDVARVGVLIDLSLPALKARLQAGDPIGPPWARFIDDIGRYGLPQPPRIRHARAAGQPLLRLVVAYRS